MVVHSLTGLTPNMAMVGREVLVPVTLIAKPPEETSVVTAPLCQICAGYAKPHRQSPKRKKMSYDRTIKPAKFVSDQLVWLY